MLYMKKISQTLQTALPARDRILEAAHGLFYSEGIRATGIDRVIAESGVTKVTFYRHFPSKNDLICAYLEYRHQRWMDWFMDALRRHQTGKNVCALDALVPALSEWFNHENFRGCAFINGVGEVGIAIPEVMTISRSHKDDMTKAISELLPSSRRKKALAQAIAVAVDGAIVKAQFDESPETALQGLKLLLESVKHLELRTSREET
jgi:AcrR family transcriptional regulator